VHYIIGTEITVHDRQPLKGIVTKSTFKRRVSNAITKQLVVNTPYTLYNITVNRKSGVDYTFTSRQSREAVKITFDSVNAADSAIAQIKNEDIPDYYAEDNQRSD